MPDDEMRPDDRRSGAAGHADGGAEPRVCCGNSGADRRSDPDGDDGDEPRSGGIDGDERVAGVGEGRGPGEGRNGGLGDGRSGGLGEGRGGGVAGGRDGSLVPLEPLPEDKPLRRDDESSLTRELPPGSYVTTSG
jgi:hypothetical protein